MRGLLYESLEDVATFFERYVPSELPGDKSRPTSKGGMGVQSAPLERGQHLFNRMLGGLSFSEETLRQREEARAQGRSFLATDFAIEADEVRIEMKI